MAPLVPIGTSVTLAVYAPWYVLTVVGGTRTVFARVTLFQTIVEALITKLFDGHDEEVIIENMSRLSAPMVPVSPTIVTVKGVPT